MFVGSEEEIRQRAELLIRAVERSKAVEHTESLQYRRILKNEIEKVNFENIHAESNL